jgi:uncharacterized protein YaeQ
VSLWWQQVGEKLERQERLAVTEVPVEATRALADMAQRSMRLQVTLQEGQVLVADGTNSVAVELIALKTRPTGR